MKHRCENGYHIYEGIEKRWKRMFQILWKELHLKWKQEKISEIIYEKKEKQPVFLKRNWRSSYLYQNQPSANGNGEFPKQKDIKE